MEALPCLVDQGREASYREVAAASPDGQVFQDLVEPSGSLGTNGRAGDVERWPGRELAPEVAQLRRLWPIWPQAQHWYMRRPGPSFRRRFSTTLPCDT